jgi:predicted lysophospholipase L1 biosynthesis ABC-type transport system permease subunit
MLEGARRSPVIRARLVEIAGEARDRVAAAAGLARTAGALRDDVEPAHLAALLVALALGILVGAEVGASIEVEALRETVGALVAPPGGVRVRPALSGAAPRPRRRR